MKRILVACMAVSLGVCVIASLFFVGHAQSLPAPTVDRVGFPAGYQDAFKLLYVFDNYQNRQIRKVYGNDVAASVTPGQVFNFPYGSIVLFESYTVKEDSNGERVTYFASASVLQAALPIKNRRTGSGECPQTNAVAIKIRLFTRSSV